MKRGYIEGSVISGESGNTRPVHKLPTVTAKLALTLKEAFCGCRKKFHLAIPTPCVCLQERRAENQNQKMCPFCARLTRRHKTLTKCSSCQEQECTLCHGKGTVSTTRKLVVPIPAGVRDGQTLILPEQGVSRPGSSVLGDIHVTCKIKTPPEEKQFDIRNGHLCYTRRAPLEEIIMGTPFHIQHLNGCVLEFPASEEILNPDRVMKVSGEGWPALGENPVDDLYIFIQVIYPDRCYYADGEEGLSDSGVGENVVVLQEANVWEANPSLASRYFQPPH